MINTILFDLDGTLLPMDQDEFTKTYFESLTAKLSKYGYERKALIDGIWSGTSSMIKNDGSCTNEEVFWKRFSEIFNKKVYEDKPIFEEYYKVDFQKCSSNCCYNNKAKETIDKLKNMGYKLALATNPIFPAIATESRIRWAGLEPSDFIFYTTYENTNYCKPNLEYYRNLLQRLDCRADECLMVGNDVDEDMVAGEIGTSVFLLTDCLINKNNKNITTYPGGDFEALMEYIVNDTKAV